MYEKLRRVVLDVINCDDGAPSANMVIDRITKAYSVGEISNHQHKTLMCYLHDLV